MALKPHLCDDRCVCPVHGTPLIYWPAGDDHACREQDCIYAHGMDEGNLRALSSFFVPLSPGERVRQEQLYSTQEGGQLTSYDIKFAMIAIGEGWY